MIQNAVVTELVSPGVVRVSLKREAACGSNCPSCNGCLSQQPKDIFALAEDNLGLNLSLGEWVELESNAGNSIAISFMVYLLPCVTMLLGYVLATELGMGETLALIPAGLGVVVGFLPAKLLDKNIAGKNAPEFTIVKRKKLS